MGEYFGDELLEDHFIRDLTPLKTDYQPDSIDERDEKLNEYVSELSPILKGWDADNIFLFGESGVGKTLSTRILLPELRERARTEGIDVDIIETNCSGVSSSYQATISIINEMRNPTSPITTIALDESELNTTGYPSSMVYSKLFESLQKGGEYLILVLDEIDGIGVDGELLYQLTRGQAMGKLDSEVCIIGISNDLYFKNNLKSSVRDTLCESEIHFPSYETADLRSILSRRATQALYDDVLDESVIPLCSALATKENGSARYAIRLLRKTVRIAENKVRNGEEITIISDDIVNEAANRIEQNTVKMGIQNLNSSQLYVLLATVSAQATSIKPVKTQDIYSKYTYITHTFGGDALSRRSVHNHILSLVDKGLLEITNEGRKKNGVANQYALVTDISVILSAMQTSERIDFDLDVEQYIAEHDTLP